MILAVDIGNTNINIGLFKEDRLCLKGSLPIAKAKDFALFLGKKLKPKAITGQSLRKFIALSFPRKRESRYLDSPVTPAKAGAGNDRFSFTNRLLLAKIEAAVVCSVVPKATMLVKKAISRWGDFPIYILGRDLIVPIKNLYGRPKQVGQDRLVCVWQAMRRYGAPVVAVDLGTAVTFDAVSKRGEYLGGVILPGLRLSLKALRQGTALLPEVNLEEPQRLIGKDTKGSMLSGVVYGFSSLTDGLVEKLRWEIGRGAKVVITGGDARFIRRYCSNSYYFEPDLILKGLNGLAMMKKNAKKT